MSLPRRVGALTQPHLLPKSIFFSGTIPSQGHRNGRLWPVETHIKCDLVTSQIREPPTEDVSDLVNKKMIWKQDLECATTRLSETRQMEAFSPVVGSGVDAMGRNKEDCVPITHMLLAVSLLHIKICYGILFRG